MRQQGKSLLQYHSVVFNIDQKMIGNPNARKLWQSICIEAESNNVFKEKVITYLKTGGTVFLRDELCYQFKKEFLTESDWFNAFCSIDSRCMEVA